MNQVEKQLKRAIDAHTPDVLEKILLRCEQQTGDVTMTEMIGVMPKVASEPKANVAWKRWVSTVAALLIVVFGGYYGYGYYAGNVAVDSVIAFDVNPSIQLTVNRAEKVLSAKALNSDADIILKDMNLKGVDLEVAVNALIGAMLKNGYVDEIKNSILISVEHKNQQKSTALQTRLSSEVASLLDAYSVKGAVLSQTVTDDERLAALAKEHGTSLGKAALVDLLVSQDTRLNFADIAKLSINDINLLMAAKGMTTENLASSGRANSSEYIGEEKALSVARQHANVQASEATLSKVKLDWDDRRMVYDIEFFSGDVEYDYEIDAVTGAILAFDRDVAHPPIAKPLPSSRPAIVPPVAPSPQVDQYIGNDKAKRIALDHAGLQDAPSNRLRVSLDSEHNKVTYDVEFRNGRTEYEYEIDAISGQIIEWDSEYDD